MHISKIISARFFAIVDSQTSFKLCYAVGSWKFWKLGAGVAIGIGHFTSDSVTLFGRSDKILHFIHTFSINTS